MGGDFEAIDVVSDELEACLGKDYILVQYFNSFLALTAFPKQLVYNTNSRCFEAFHNTLADDVDGEGNVNEATTLKHRFEYFKTTINESKSKIGYYAKVFEKQAGFEWVLENRLLIFLRSELYADYKLSKELAFAQVKFLDGLIKEQLESNVDEGIDQDKFTTLQAKLFSVTSQIRGSYVNINCQHAHIYEILWLADREQNKDDLTRGGLLDDSDDLYVNLYCKQGVDAFKSFVCQTPGEKHLLLWIILERSKNFPVEEKPGILHLIKERFLKAGSPHEFSKDALKSWRIGEVSSITLEALHEKQPSILEPLLKYWCHRFTTHKYKEKLKLIHDLSSTLSVAVKSETPVPDRIPLRPFSCSSHIRTFDEENRDAFSDAGNVDTGITRQKMRTKSAYPRIVCSAIPKNTNAGHRQLQLMSSQKHQGFGFKAYRTKYYHNEACTMEDKKSVRLYIQPVPPYYVAASTIREKSVSISDDIEESMEFEKDLDSLVDMLLHEHHTGQYFYHYLATQNNEVWMNCYRFWRCVQEFTEYFFADAFQPSLVSRKANSIYYTFIGHENPLQFPEEMRQKIRKKIDPPYEDLFDQAEMFILSVLVQPWLTLVMKENQQHACLKSEDHMRYIEISRTQRLEQNIDDETFHTPEEAENEENKISPEEVKRPLQVKDGMGFEALLKNKVELEHFQNFLETRHKQGILDLSAWTDIEVFKRMPRGVDTKLQEERDKKAMEIREKWLSKNYFLGPNTPASKLGIKKVLEVGGHVKTLPKRPSSPVIVEAQKYSRARVERRWLILFKETKEFLQRKKQSNSVNELVEDLLMKKKIQRSEHAWRLLNNRWNSNNREVAGLRMALTNELDCNEFRQYIKFHGEMMENNLNFWLEVQKYKDLCHNHVQDSIIKNKIQTIIDVFIKSAVPPELQIDIPTEVLERLLEKAYGKTPQLGPYLFREPQTTVFRILFNIWKEFQTFCSQATENGHLKHALEELEKQQKQELSKKKLIAERKRLYKILADKRRPGGSTFRDKNKLHDILSVMATDTDNASVVPDYETISFHYSKHKAEDELKAVEARLKEQLHIPLDDSDKKSTLPPSTPHPKSVHSEFSEKGENTQTFANLPQLSRKMSFFNTNGAIAMRKMSLGIAYNKEEEIKVMRELGKSMTGSDSRKTRIPGDIRHRSRDKSRYSDNKSRFGFDKSFDQMSSVTDLNGPIGGYLLSNKPATRGRGLTKQSLKEFEKTPEGKPLKALKMVSLPYMQDFSKSNYEPSEPVPLEDTTRKKPKPKVKVINRPIPRNAGTAAIYEKQLKESLRVESPPPVIEAEVVVC